MRMTKNMLYHLVMLNMAITWALSIPQSSPRSLSASCNSYSNSDWSGCNSDPLCTIQNGVCNTFDPNRLRSILFDQKTAGKFWSNLPESGYIVLEKFEDHTINLHRESGATAASNSVCEWRVIINHKAKLTITISRNSNIYEDILIDANTGDSEKIYTSKDLLSCGATQRELVLDNTSVLKLRVQVLDDRSDYSITLKQHLESNQNIKHWVITTICCIGIVIILAFWGILFYFGYKRFKNYRKNRKSCLPSKEGIMKKMRSGNFAQLPIEFNQESCVVCLESFDSSSEVHIINECSHVFHSICLSEWLGRIQPKVVPHCPHCSVEITIHSRPKKHKVATHGDIANTAE